MTQRRLFAALAASLFALAAVHLALGPAPFREGAPPGDLPLPPRGRVIFVTLDGVRQQDLREVWTRLRERVRRAGFFFGLDENGETMEVSNGASRSLPGYRAIFTGRYERACWTNDCDRIGRSTLIDALLDRGFSPSDAATFSSWERIPLATESRPRAARSAGFEPLQNADDLPPAEQEMFRALSESARSAPPPWPHSRTDQVTWAMAREYDRVRHPRFLYVSLGESDEQAHRDDFAAYASALRRYEDDLLRWLDDADLGDDVSFVITTDHGRGESRFRSHGWWIPSSSRIWAAVIPSRALRMRGVHKREGRAFRQVDVRPTLEYLLGVQLQEDREGEPLVLLRGASPSR